MKVSYVIPIFNHWKLINDLLCQIYDHSLPDEIIVVDDCSTDQETVDGIKWWAENYDIIKILRPEENQGFLKSSNYGVSQATGDIVCLISSDVRVEDDLAKTVKEVIALDPKVLIGGVLYSHSTGWNDFEGRIFKYLEGWLLCFTKETWADLGGFDERYAPSDYEDVCLSTTAIQKGYSLIPLNNPKIKHMGGGTYGYDETRTARTTANREKFRAKWLTTNS